MEVLVPSCDGFGHKISKNDPQPGGRALPQQATIKEKVVKPQTTENNGMSTIIQVKRDVSQDITRKTKQVSCQ